MKINDLPFNKNNFINLKKERDMLKITLEYITEENKNLKNELNDMKITAKKNKDMLREYINQITNKDKLFEKMASTIEQLKSRLKAMEQFKKEKEKNEKENINYYSSNDCLNINNNTNNHTTTTTSNNLTTNNIIGTTSGENYSFGFNILNNNINKIKNFNINESVSTKNSNKNKSMNNINLGNTGNKGFNILRNNNKKNKINANNLNNNMENIMNQNKNISFNNQNDNQNIESNEKNKIDNNNNNNNNALIPEDSIKYFYEKQKNIMEEISIIKDDIQFLMENRSKSKIKDKLNQSLASCNSLNSSFCSENKNLYDNNNKENNLNNSIISENNGQQSLDNSYISQNLSNLSVSYYGADQNILRHLNYTLNISSVNYPQEAFNGTYGPGTLTVENSKKRKKYNLKERYFIDENFTNFMFKTNTKKDILFLIDGKENVWEIIRRADLTADQIRKYDKEKDKEYSGKIKSVINMIGDNNNKEKNIINLISGKNKSGNIVNIGEHIDKERGVNFLDNNLIDIEIKEPTDNIFK